MHITMPWPSVWQHDVYFVIKTDFFFSLKKKKRNRFLSRKGSHESVVHSNTKLQRASSDATQNKNQNVRGSEILSKN